MADWTDDPHSVEVYNKIAELAWKLEGLTEDLKDRTWLAELNFQIEEYGFELIPKNQVITELQLNLEAQKAQRVGRAMQAAESTFDDAQKAQRWMVAYSTTLDGRPVLIAGESIEGLQRILDDLKAVVGLG